MARKKRSYSEADKKLLEAIFGEKPTNYPKCNFTECLHGGGLAGFDTCITGEDGSKRNCPEFADTEEFLRTWRGEDERDKESVD